MPTVIMEMHSGLIEMISNPHGVRVILWDYDVDGADEDVLKTDKAGNYYQEIEL